MTSLAEVYEGHVGEVRSLQRLYLGTGLFAVGALLVATGIVSATTTLPSAVSAALTGSGMLTWQSWELAGVLAGLGVPAVFVGVFTVLPASRHERAAAAIGAGIAVFGVMLFLYAFPYQWHGDPNPLTLPVVAVYCFGTLTTFWCLFTSVANFKTRNDPGGSVTLELDDGGEVRTVEVSQEDLENVKSTTGGGIGVLGDIVEQATSEPDRQSNAAGGQQSGSVRTASDGGSTGDQITSPFDDSEVMEPETTNSPSTTDQYCGNCEHFRYVRTSQGMQPHCGLHQRHMDDMDACEQWRPNNDR